MTTPQARPTPLRDAARSVGGVITLLATVVTMATTIGVLTMDQGGALRALLALVEPVVTAATGLLVAFHVVRRAEPLVTPVEDPRDNAGRKLVAGQE